LTKRFFQTASGKGNAAIQSAAGLFLHVAHASLSAHSDLVEEVDELTVLAYKEMDVFGEVLTESESFKAVGDQMFAWDELCGKQVVHGDSLAGETGEFVANSLGGHIEVTGDGANIRAANQLLHERAVGHGSFCIIIDTESLRGKGLAAAETAEAGNAAESFGMIVCEVAVPRMV